MTWIETLRADYELSQHHKLMFYAEATPNSLRRISHDDAKALTQELANHGVPALLIHPNLISIGQDRMIWVTFDNKNLSTWKKNILINQLHLVPRNTILIHENSAGEFVQAFLLVQFEKPIVINTIEQLARIIPIKAQFGMMQKSETIKIIRHIQREWIRMIEKEPASALGCQFPKPEWKAENYDCWYETCNILLHTPCDWIIDSDHARPVPHESILYQHHNPSDEAENFILIIEGDQLYAIVGDSIIHNLAGRYEMRKIAYESIPIETRLQIAPKIYEILMNL